MSFNNTASVKKSFEKKILDSQQKLFSLHLHFGIAH